VTPWPTVIRNLVPVCHEALAQLAPGKIGTQSFDLGAAGLPVLVYGETFVGKLCFVFA
jgi:hypothetical protein